jgi:hypothetical protein
MNNFMTKLFEPDLFYTALLKWLSAQAPGDALVVMPETSPEPGLPGRELKLGWLRWLRWSVCRA